VWQYGLHDAVLWYYTPMAVPWTDHLSRSATVFDCMDHLAGFKGAPAGLLALDAKLLRRADLVLTGGAQLYAAKRSAHHNVHCFPSSVDVAHFGTARGSASDPADQAGIAHPRLGYCGVIDERMDLDLIANAAACHPEWQFVMLGPVVKIDPETLPRRANLHYLGMKTYEELPAYLGGWDAAIMPFAHNEATRYISPTKTPEYLAAGLPVASTGIHDVVEPYGRLGLVEIGDGPAGFLAACERALATDRARHEVGADAILSQMSWDRTWAAMDALVAVASERALEDVPDLGLADPLPVDADQNRIPALTAE
jgi:glycosyltransferase involved in cell wall biosynthesis